MTPAPEVGAAGEIREFDARGGRDDHVAGVRVRERRPRPLERVRLVEERGVSVVPLTDSQYSFLTGQ